MKTWKKGLTFMLALCGFTKYQIYVLRFHY
jgi:hypothetical protein